MVCHNCGTQLPEGTNFCFSCGAKVEPVQNGEMDELFGMDFEETVVLTDKPSPAFVPNEPEPINASPVPVNVNPVPVNVNPMPINVNSEPMVQNYYQDNFQQNPVNVKTKKKGGKKALIAVLAVILVAILGVGAYFVITNLPEKKTEAPFVYVSGEDLYVCKTLNEKEEPVHITDSFADLFIISKDSKHILYSERNSKSSESDYDYEYDLYYKEIFNEKDEGTLIAKNVSSTYTLDENLNKIIYLKNDKIYYGEPKGEFEKVASDVYIRYLDTDSSKAICSHYYSDEDDYDKSYYEVGIIDFTDEHPEYDILIKSCKDFNCKSDCSEIFYTDNDKLYSLKPGEDKQKISDEKINYFYVTEKGVYYTVNTDEITYYDMVDDKYAESDKKLVEPKWEDFEVDSEKYYKEVYNDYWEEYEEVFDYDAYYAARDKAQENYQKAWKNYDQAEYRNELRESLSERIITSCYDVYYYDGTESNKVFENADNFYYISDLNGLNTAYRARVISTAVADMKKIAIDDVNYYDDIYDSFVKQAEYKDFVTSNGSNTELETDDDISAVYVDSKAGEYYLFTKAKKSKKEIYDFYTLKIGSTFAEATLVAEDCNGFMMIGGEPNYYDSYDEDDYTCTVYLSDKEKIDDVYDLMVETDGDGAIYYSTDYDKKTYGSTVYKFKDGEKEKIGDDIYFSPNSFGIYDGKYVYITDFDIDDYEGTLMCKDGDETFKVDSGVKRFYNGNMEYCRDINAQYDYYEN